MSETQRDDKQVKREARQMWEDSRGLAERGDFRSLRAADARLVALAPDTDFGRQARAELEDLKVDRRAIYAGLAALVLYAATWVLSLG